MRTMLMHSPHDILQAGIVYLALKTIVNDNEWSVSRRITVYYVDAFTT